jgi:hypothetical protein
MEILSYKRRCGPAMNFRITGHMLTDQVSSGGNVSYFTFGTFPVRVSVGAQKLAAGFLCPAGQML